MFFAKKHVFLKTTSSKKPLTLLGMTDTEHSTTSGSNEED